MTPRSILVVLPWSFHEQARAVKMSHSVHTFPAQVEKDDALPSCFSANIVSNFFWPSLSCTFCISVLCLGNYVT